jgi:DNA-directed RNA polymerase
MLNHIVEILDFRTHSELAPQNPLKYLREYSSQTYIAEIITTLYLYTRPEKRSNKQNMAYLTELAAAIGHEVRLKLGHKQNSALATKTGAFILYTFEEEGILEVVLGRGKRKHNSYLIRILDDEAIVKLWESLPDKEIKKLPSLIPYEPWTKTFHETGLRLVKTNAKRVLKALTPKTHPIVFNCVNRAQTVGWQINEFIYDLHLWALRNKTDAFADIWEQQDPEAKATKLREARAIGDIAKRFLHKTFYHQYYYDFRGRKYPATAYLHEQGSDFARGLLLRDDKKAIGKDGFFWMMVSLACNWAGDAGRDDGLKTDKLPLRTRFEWALDNEEIFLSYAESPKVNQGWMKADKPWQFLAVCLELCRFREWQSFHNGIGYGYESHLECFIDGSTNGSQHLAALTRDEITAPHVNLMPSDLPGDLYTYVADFVWKSLEKQIASYPREKLSRCETFIDDLIELKKQITAAEPKSTHRKALIEEIQKFKADNMDIFEDTCPVFWSRIKDNKDRRKVVKRNVMTLPYGGTAYGLG